ncbi:MAG: OmpH family outer membrane protein [Bacteroidales bacterium]|jgi:outer membrane protein|nr:OmpH family outer membrane protein [Bacteroidales bacterium]MBQ1607071.1 OmpH family outer membrane protein [Bacteroidales bacterium]MBQ1652224.1 OmpH family outer membrane protein [Bacteroidales bacterium]MBQ1695666.1 OmpH family outer membrane protein [Bacteroidales bacterium]MBQ1730847.1 OmpH family outer membrane protein [Bacteroidales bacterium]
MKRIILLAVAILFATFAFSQKYAYVDTEYILNNIPVYESAKTQLEDLTKEWKKEIDAKKASIDQMYQNYQSERILLTEELRAKREDEIMKKEQELKQLQQKYFGESGMLYKKREELIKPIQDDIYNAIKEIATEGNYAVIFDTANNLNMLYTDPRHDKSDEVLRKLGYKN